MCRRADNLVFESARAGNSDGAKLNLDHPSAGGCGHGDGSKDVEPALFGENRRTVDRNDRREQRQSRGAQRESSEHLTAGETGLDLAQRLRRGIGIVEQSLVAKIGQRHEHDVDVLGKVASLRDPLGHLFDRGEAVTRVEHDSSRGIQHVTGVADLVIDDDSTVIAATDPGIASANSVSHDC